MTASLVNSPTIDVHVPYFRSMYITTEPQRNNLAASIMPARKKGVPSSQYSSHDGLIRMPSNTVEQAFGSPNVRVHQVCRIMEIDNGQLKGLMNEVRKLILQHLDVYKPFVQQNPKDIDRLEREALRQIPLLRRYEGGWATLVLVRRLFHRRYALVADKSCSSPTRAATQDQGTESSPSRDVRSLPSTLVQFLKPIKPNVFKYLLPLTSAGLVDNNQFQEFLTLSLDVKRGFIRHALEEKASERELRAILNVIEKLDNCT